MSGSMRIVRASLVLTAASLPRAQAGVVHVVDASGNGDFVRIQRAVDVAIDGDTILVKGGQYVGFGIAGKALSIVAEDQQLVVVRGTVTVSSLSASRDVVLAGLRVEGTTHGLVLNGNAGSVRLQSCELRAPDFAGSGLSGAWVGASADVVFSACTIRGGLAGSASGPALRVQGSSVALYDCELTGGPGHDADCVHGDWGGAGGAGAVAYASFLFASGSSFVGGEGGDSWDLCAENEDGGDGAPGLALHSSSTAAVLDCLFSGGTGGQASCGSFGCGQPGSSAPPTFVESGSSLSTLPGTRRSLESPALVREPPSSIPLTVHGLPGDAVFLRISRQTSFAYVPNQSGVRSIPESPPPIVLDLGVVPSGGTLVTAIASFALGPGAESRTYFLQTIHREPNGSRVLGTPASVVVLDSAF